MLASPASKHIIAGLEAEKAKDYSTPIKSFKQAIEIFEDPKINLNPELNLPYNLALELKNHINKLD